MFNTIISPDNLPTAFIFHHIGYATNSLSREIDSFALIGYRQEGDIFRDHIQGISGCFLTGPGPRIELLENLPGAHTLTPWLSVGIKMYHFAYQTPDISKAVDWARQQRARVTVPPVAAVAFGNRRISFVMLRNGLMLEFIEHESQFESQVII